MGSEPALDADELVREILVQELERDPTLVHSERSLAHDLELDSLALIELRQIIEDRLRVQIPEARAVEVRTVGDLVSLVSHLQSGAPAPSPPATSRNGNA